MQTNKLVFVVGVTLLMLGPDLYAQSGSRSRGSGTRGARISPGMPSRVGGARSKVMPTRGRPTGILNSANAARMSGSRMSGSRMSGSRMSGFRSSGSSTRGRPTTGYQSGSSLAGSRSYKPPSRSGTLRPKLGTRQPSTGLTRTATGRSTTSLANSAGSAGEQALLPGYRIWTDASGKYAIPGKLAAYRDGTVWIRRTDGKLARLSVTQLSQPDQQFLSKESG